MHGKRDATLFPIHARVSSCIQSHDFSIKYAPQVMTEWPIHLQNSLQDGVSHHSKSVFYYYSDEELQEMATWPFWRVKLTKFSCLLETRDGSR